MGARGPAAKPVEIKELEGNPGRRPLNSKAPNFRSAAESFAAAGREGRIGKRGRKRAGKELLADGRGLVCPSWLTGEARRVWEQVVVELEAVGEAFVGPADVPMLAMLCREFGRYVEYERMLARDGETYQTPTGFTRVRPEVRLRQETLKSVMTLADRFGLSPSARGRLVYEAPANAADLVDDMFFGSGAG